MSENLKLAGLSRVNVLGVGVHAIDMRQALAVFRRTLEDRRKGYVCVTGVHGIMEAQKYPEFKAILNGTLLRSEEHTSELQSRLHLVCRLLLEKKKTSPSLDHRVRSTKRPTPRY